jgi:peptidoglycan/xylan/chitin deacetylase (PgdA/CDA1 family)
MTLRHPGDPSKATPAAKRSQRIESCLLPFLSALVLCLGPVWGAAQGIPTIGATSGNAETGRLTRKDLPVADLLRYAPAPFEIRLPPLMPAVPARIVHNGPRHARRVALTFDACASRQKSGYDERLVQVLEATRTPATLFLGGKWMTEHPEATRYLASRDQFELANHSFLHPHLVNLPDDRVRQELWWTQAIMYSLTGRQAQLLRAPFAEIDDRVAGLAAQMGLTAVQHDLASGDPDAGATADRLVKTVLQRVRNGSIVVMHMNGRGRHTAEALPVIIDELRRRGFELTSVGALIRSEP